MAGQNGRRSSQTGSDAVFDITCTPCGEDGVQQEAIQYCPNCEEYLCSACTKCHQRMKATRGHTLTGATQAKQTPVVTVTTIEEKCLYHPDRNIEMFCGTHNMVYCARCIATEHRSCNGVTDIEHAIEGNYSTEDLKGIQSEINELYEQLVDMGKKKGKILAETEEQKASILGKIKDLKKKMTDHIEKLEKITTETMTEKYSEVKKELDEDISIVNKMIVKLEERRTKLNVAAQIDKGQRFVQAKLAQKATSDAKKLCKENRSGHHKVIVFVEDEGLGNTVIKKQAFGQVKVVEQQKELEIKTVTMGTVEDKFKCLISDLCQLQDGSIIVIDQRNRSLKKLDKYYVAKIVCEFNSEPTGICCTGKNEVAVKKRNNEVAFITINGYDIGEHTRYISIEDGGSWGIAYFARDLWVSFRGGIRVYSLLGDLKDVITDVIMPSGEEIDLSPIHLAVRNNSIFVANGQDEVLCLDRDGDLKYILEDDRLRFTRGVCVTRRGTVFMCGSQSNNVFMFNKLGKEYPIEIVAANKMPEKGPVALLYDYTKNCLLITSNGSSNVTVVD